MKTILTLLLATTASTTALAYDEGRITITLASKKNMVVYVDGRQYQEQDNTIVLNGVRAGSHNIRIYSTKKNKRNNNRNNNRKQEELLYSTTIYLKPSYHVDVMVNRFGKALVDERALSDRDRWDDDEEWQDDNNSYNHAMADREFNVLLQRIKNSWFSSSKLNEARDGINKNYFTTAQVKQILQLLSFEDHRLELAKLSYSKIVDRRNFYQLYDVFTMQSSKNELESFVRSYR